jgi:Transposase DDE domain
MDWDTELSTLNQCLDDIPETDPRAEIQPREFVSALAFSFVRHQAKRSIESLRDGVQSICGKRIARSSFWERLAARRLRGFLEAAIQKKMACLNQGFSIGAKLLEQLGITGIELIDSTSNSLPEAAEEAFPAPRNNVLPASVKLHVGLDLLRGAISWFEMSPAKEHDRKHFPMIRSLAGKLVIFDLGYFDFWLMEAIARAGGFFLSRLKSNTRVLIVRVVEGLPKRDLPGTWLLDHKLQAGKGGCKRIVEVIGDFFDEKQRVLEARVIGFWNPAEKQYHWYVTNLKAAAVLIYPLYRIRWQLELFFKCLKQTFRLADQPSANENIVNCLVLLAVLVSLIAFPLSRALAMEYIESRKLGGNQSSFAPTPSLQRGARMLLFVADECIEYIRNSTRRTAQALLEKLRQFAPDLIDPNYARRESSLARVIRMAAALA